MLSFKCLRKCDVIFLNQEFLAFGGVPKPTCVYLHSRASVLGNDAVTNKHTCMHVLRYIFYYIFKDWITYFHFVLIENSQILFSLEIWLDNMWVWVSRTNAGKQQAGDPNGKQNNIKLYNIWWFFILNLFNIFN